MENKGKLLISTQAAPSRKIVVGIWSIFVWILGILAIFNFSVFREMGDDLLDSPTIGIILGIVMIGSSILVPILAFMRFKSYCNVYENRVTGVTGNLQSFDITYKEILNVTESVKTIFIHTQYATYEVLAMRNLSEALSEIKKRLEKA